MPCCEMFPEGLQCLHRRSLLAEAAAKTTAQSQHSPSETQHFPTQVRFYTLKSDLVHSSGDQTISFSISRSHEAPAPHRKPPVKDTKEPKADQHRRHRGSRGRRHNPNFPCYRSQNPSPVRLNALSLEQDAGGLSVHRESDSDSSEPEHSDPTLVPPQLQLRPEVIEDETSSPLKQRGGRNHGDYAFPDFLPPPFNSWNLSQLAAFYHVEGRSSPRPRPVALLERYLDRLLQLEWRQIQTSQEEGGKPAVCDVTSSCHKPAAATSRLSSPKCILQCQRAFPLTFLSSLTSHSALLAGCACTPCRLRYSTCSRSCCRSAYSYNHHFRLSPTLEHKVTVPLPKRSCSESRAYSSDGRAQRFSSPVRTNNHLRRMQASGNIRSQVLQGGGTKLQSSGGEPGVGAEQSEEKREAAEFRRRSGSEQRRGRAERQRSGAEMRRGASEYRRGGLEGRRAAHLKEREIKPDAVAAIMDNLPASKNSFRIRTNREKQVEFVT